MKKHGLWSFTFLPIWNIPFINTIPLDRQLIESQLIKYLRPRQDTNKMISFGRKNKRKKSNICCEKCKLNHLLKCSRHCLRGGRILKKWNSIKFMIQHDKKTIEIISLEPFLRKKSTRNMNETLTIKNGHVLINQKYIFNIWGLTTVFYSGKSYFLPNLIKNFKKHKIKFRTFRIIHYEKNLSRLTTFGSNSIMNRSWAWKTESLTKLHPNRLDCSMINLKDLNKKYKQTKTWKILTKQAKMKLGSRPPTHILIN